MQPSNRIQTLHQQIEETLFSLFRDREPQSLYQPMRHPLQSGGKRIRPLLLLLSAEAVGGDTEVCMNAAVAIELLHSFTLVHDDIMDHDDMRRGQPTVHVQWDEPTAILAGDGLVTMAYQSLLKTEHSEIISVLKRFTEGLLVLCEGQALDKAFEQRASVDMDEYLTMIHKKTAKLLEVSCEIGGILGKGTEKQVTGLKYFARELGIAFQIQDDLLDLICEETVFGKPRASDLMEKKQTYLTIHFCMNAPENRKKEYQQVFGKKELSPGDIRIIQELFEQAGTISAAREVIQQGTERAIRHLAQLEPGESRDLLETFALKIRDRAM